jgi:hypothetical protein
VYFVVFGSIDEDFIYAFKNILILAFVGDVRSVQCSVPKDLFRFFVTLEKHDQSFVV